MTRPYISYRFQKVTRKLRLVLLINQFTTPFLGRDKIKLMVRYDYISFLQAQQYHLKKFMGDNCLIFLFL